ncbi:MAG: hypothetical protein ACI4EA_05885 [Candidatus Ornithomonoglobus sp.]
MKKDDKLLKKDIDYVSIFMLVLSVLAVFFIMWTFTGQWPWKGQPYNSYILQAQSWLNGRLDLGQNYPHLELAIKDGKYYVSFPPFPSYLMLPFVLVGWNACDGFLALVSSVAGAVYAFKILESFNVKSERAILFALLLTVGSNWLFTSQNAWVWFIAQNMSFTLTLMAFYYALKYKAGFSLLCWACAVGCRPFQIIYIAVILYVLYKGHKKRFPEDKPIDIIKKKWSCAVPMLIVALSYMALNYARFGNPAEFGHDLLPEHVRSELGQFNLSYILKNFPSLFTIPKAGDGGKWEYSGFGDISIFLVSPIFISYIVYVIYSLVRKCNKDRTFTFLSLGLIVLHFLALSAHVNLGGSQFGNRYTNDVLPIVLLNIAALLPEKKSWEKYNAALLLMGLTINIIGSVLFYAK